MKNALLLLMYHLVSQNTIVSSGCINDSSTDFQLTATGYFVKDILACVYVCNSFTPPGVFSYSFFLEGELCFCRNASLPLLETSKFESPCVRSTCFNNSNDSNCFLSSYEVLLLSSGIVEWNITYNPAIALVDDKVQIQTNILTAEPSSAYMRPLPNDLLSDIQTVNGMTVNALFYLPGLHKWSEIIGNNFTKPYTITSWIQINENVGGIHIIPITVSTIDFCYLIITQGTNISVTLSLPTTQNLNFSADIIRLVYGMNLSLLHTTSTLTCILSDGFVLNEFLSSGRFTKLKLNVFSKGYLHVAILRPLCKNTRDICPSEINCTSACFRKRLLEAQTLNSSLTITAMVAYHFIFLVNDTGIIEIPIQNTNNDVLEDDMIWISGNVTLFCNKYEGKAEQNFGKMVAQTVTFLANTISSNEFFISLFISKPFEYLIKTPLNYGISNFSVYAYNNIPSFQQLNFSINKQIPAMNLKFDYMNPCPSFVAGYKLNSWITFKAVVDNGTDLSYVFNIPKLNYTSPINSGQVDFKTFSLGDFTVYLTAANKLSSLNTSIKISVLSGINSLILFVEKNLLQDHTFILNVTVYNGSNVNLTIDFGDGTPQMHIKNVDANDAKGFTYTALHRYSDCKKFTITAFAANSFAYGLKISNALLSNSTNVTVFCSMSPLNVKAIPIIPVNGHVLLSVNKSLKLNIHQYRGSYLLYSIDWGDGSFTFNNQTMNFNPISFLAHHIYTKESKYNISVTSRSYFQTLSYLFSVQVKNCSAPEVSFYYGTLSNPMAVIWSVGVDLTAYVENINPLCKQEDYSFQWNLTSYSEKSITNQDVVTIVTQSQQRVIFRIMKRSLDIGLYVFTMIFNYGGYVNAYAAYLNVMLSPLYVNIENGFLNSIAYKIINENNSFYQNFTLSAMSSYDPDDSTIGVQNITFEWKCKIAANFSYALEVMENFKLLNLTYQSNTCFSPTWISIPFFSPYISYNTQQFLEGISYHFEVCGTKFAGTDVDLNKINKTSCFTQELFFVSKDLPTVTVTCISNCNTKLNFKERVVYSFDCKNCGARRLMAEWSITDETNDIPSEITKFLNATSTGFYNPSIVINKDILLESKHYTFRLMVGFADSLKRVKFEFTKSTCSLPTPGFCNINPTEGYALETKFILVCYDWSDSDGFLSYRFYYDNGLSQNMNMSSTTTINYPLLNGGSVYQPSLVNFILGPGKESLDYQIRILIKVNGKYEAYAEYTNLFVKVRPKDKQLDIAELLNGISLNDTQTIGNLVQAVSSATNKMSASITNNTPIVDNFTGIVDIDALNQQKQKLFILQNIRTQMIDLLNNIPINDLNSFKLVADALHLTSQYPLELVSQTQSKASSTILKMSEVFTKKNLKGFGADNFDTMSQSYVKSISNLFLAFNNNTDTCLQNSTVQTTLNPKHSDFVATNLLKSLESYFNAVQFYKVSGENSTIGQTSQFTFDLVKSLSSDLSNISIGSFDANNNEHGFILPNSTDLFNDSIQNTQIAVNNLRMKNMVYTWDTNWSQNILSETQSLSFSDVDGLPIEVTNSSQPINIAIKNIPEKMIGNKILLSMPSETYLVKLPLKSGCNMLLKFFFKNDPNSLTNLVVYIQYGKVATKHDYDIMLNISAKQGIIMTKNSLPVNTTFSEVLQRNQDVHILDDGTLLLWNFMNSTYAVLNKNELHLLLSYYGPIPAKQLDLNLYTFDETESSGAFEYEIKSFCVECSYWNKDANRWMSDGCELDVPNTSFFVTKCKCTHLTAFGGLFVAPNPLRAPTFLLLKNGYALTVTVAIVLLMWLIGLVFIRRMDKKDVSKVGVCPLLDNRDGDKYMYQIIVNTGNRKNAGTKSNIFFTVTGDANDSGVRRLKDSVRECFQRSACDIFIMTTEKSLGDLDFIRLWHDNSGGSWYLDNIVIKDIQTQKQFLFIGHHWIAVDHGSCMLDCVIPVASEEDQKCFNYIFTKKAKGYLSDEHLWFSIFARPPKSSFTRCQRLSVAVSLLMTSMMVSTMYYGKIDYGTSNENKSVFSISKIQIFVVLICTCIKIPLHLLLVNFFRSIKPFSNTVHTKKISLLNKETLAEDGSSISLDLINNKTSSNQLSSISNIVIDEEKTLKKTNQKKTLPHWCLYIAWFFCVGNILVSGAYVLLMGMQFGNTKSLNWLASITIDLVKEIFLTDPIKIFILAIFVAAVYKKVNEEECEVEKQGIMLAQDESWLYKPKDEPTIFDQECIEIQPLDSNKLIEMRELRFKQLKMHAVITEICFYIFYAVLVMFIGYTTRETIFFHQTNNLEQLFNMKSVAVQPKDNYKIFNQIKSSKDFWLWIERFFLPQVFPEPWYKLDGFYANTNKNDFPGKLFLNDLCSKIVNGIRIRQIRVQSNSCKKDKSIVSFFKMDCLSSYISSLEETRDFNFNWSLPIKYKSAINPSTMPWRYQTWKVLDGYPFAANLDTYNGGGYVIEIFPKWKNTVILEHAKMLGWIDRQTRAIIIEFALFNAATNYFTMITMVLEFPASGGVVPNFSVLTFKLFASATGSKAMFISHILFIIFTIAFTIRECRIFYRTGCKYFLEFWNIVEVGLIVFPLIAVGFFFYKDYLAKLLLKRLPAKKPQAFINFQFASYWDLTYVYIVSLIVFFVTLKFIKIMRFNQRISMLSSTLKVAWYPLTMFGIIFFIIMCSAVSTSSIVFGSLLDGYQTNYKAVASIISLLLGKFSYSQFEKVNSVLGPVFFFGFNIFVIWIVMNMFITILNDAFAEVCADLRSQSNDYEIVDFIWDYFKELLGWSPLRKRELIVENLIQANIAEPSGNNGILITSRRKSRFSRVATEFIEGVDAQLGINKRRYTVQNEDHISLSSRKKSRLTWFTNELDKEWLGRSSLNKREHILANGNHRGSVSNPNDYMFFISRRKSRFSRISNEFYREWLGHSSLDKKELANQSQRGSVSGGNDYMFFTSRRKSRFGRISDEFNEDSYLEKKDHREKNQYQKGSQSNGNDFISRRKSSQFTTQFNQELLRLRSLKLKELRKRKLSYNLRRQSNLSNVTSEGKQEYEKFYNATVSENQIDNRVLELSKYDYLFEEEIDIDNHYTNESLDKLISFIKVYEANLEQKKNNFEKEPIN
ncbi:uncharacterized protein LOC100199090 isoform X7 [Hydra vulgaris]|uniref:Uncharacterized protein LOC100199090 isoform X7 n=1 Tax=Hydra vulgaris TaxID=6087 RepID=A0ABM4CEX6_HYDVU